MESTAPDTGRERPRNYDSRHARDDHSSNDVKGSRHGRLDDYNERGRKSGYDSKDRRSPVAHHRDRDERSRDYNSSKSYKGEYTGHDADTHVIQSESRRMDHPIAAEPERPSDHIRVRGRGHHHYGSHRDSAWHESGQDGRHNSSHSSVRYSTSSEKPGHRRHSRDESSSYRDKYERSRDISERREISTTRDFVPFERYDSLNSMTQSNASGYASHSRGGLESRDESRNRHLSRTEDREHKHRGRSSSRSSSGDSGSTRDRSRSRHHSRRSRSTRRTRDHSRGRSTSRSPSRSRSRSRSKERGDDDGKKRKRRHRSESRERRKRKRKDREREKEKDKRRKKEKDEEERRSVLTGKKIKLKVKQDKDDIEREKNRRDLLSFLNSTLG